VSVTFPVRADPPICEFDRGAFCLDVLRPTPVVGQPGHIPDGLAGPATGKPRAELLNC
jgi:hypothetical protein